MSDSETLAKVSVLPDFNTPAATAHRKWRNIKDIATRYFMAAGGISVILAIVLIAFYLFYVVVPMFYPAHIELQSTYTVPGNAESETLYYAMEEQREIAMRVSNDGNIVFFNAADGKVLQRHSLFQNHEQINAFAAGDSAQHLLAFATTDGKVLLVQHQYEVTYPDDVRLITPYLYYPLGETPLQINDSEIKLVTAQFDGEKATIAALSDDARIILKSFMREESLLSGEVEITETSYEIQVQSTITHMVLDVDQRELYTVDSEGHIQYYDVSKLKSPRLVHQVEAVSNDIQITSLEFLSGGISILVGDTSGRIAQWFPVRDENNNYTLERIRFFESQQAPIIDIAPEYFRKGFIAIDKSGTVSFYHTTAHRTVNLQQIDDQGLLSIAVSPRANAIVAENTSKKLQFWHVENEHPEISWQSIWGEVWYESRDKPEYIWQSSSASSDFEPKFSLSPLVYGTLKAAFYAMLFAVPMSICGAIYAAYFMAPKMRNLVKPTIEIMAALPTVILGFLAGIWFAPFVEKFMPGVFLLFLILPLAVILSAYAWHRLPEMYRVSIPDGWEAVLLIPVLIIATAITLSLSQPVEAMFFGGNMPLWITRELGLDFDQRNSLVVGIAMGFAVIPTIFSISEDAIYGVPGHLTMGSLALGATRWQTMVRVVLLTASPGIFSAVMIGLGRAVGETMIVVMATGNTAIMDMNIFQGFRALSANIAVEMPESEVNSTHYRILFLAGFVLFLATFFVNTIAEVVRQRLRTKYSSL